MNNSINIYPFFVNQVRYSDLEEQDDLYHTVNMDAKYLEKQSLKWINSEKKDINKFITDSLLSRIFRFKFNAVKWIFRNGTSLDEIYRSIDDILNEYDHKSNKAVYGLCENLRFVVRTSSRIFEAAKQNIPEEKSMGEFTEEFIPYEKLKTFLLLQGFPGTETFIHFLECNLKLEFVVMTAFQILENAKSYKPKIIDELSWTLVDLTQEIGALALELGIVKQKPSSTVISEDKVTSKELNDNQYLAEAGIKDWANHIEEWD